jgi:hypothetical protein
MSDFETYRDGVRRRLAGDLTPEEKAGREYSCPEPVSTIIAPLRELVAKISERMAKTVCHGYRDEVGKCFSLTERDCPERESPSCPKRIIDFEIRLEKLKGTAKPMELDVYQGAGIPEAIAKLIVAKEVNETESVKVVDAWWADLKRPRVLVLIGYSQIGKTVAAANLAARWQGKFVHVPTVFCNRLRDVEYQRSLLAPGLVVFDDLGLERMFPEFSACFDAAFCSRVDGGVFTIVTTNASAEDLKSRYEERITERIKNHGLVIEVAERPVLL